MEKLRLDLAFPHDAPLETEALSRAVADALRLPQDTIGPVELVKKALDARRRGQAPIWHVTVDATLRAAPDRARRIATGARAIPPPLPRLNSPRAPRDAGPIIVVGAGPAGLFAAWHLAEHGAKVVLLERGKPVETRARDFGLFRGRGELNPESNLCFGEGGAGTYSDGKLTTRKKDPLVHEVYERLVEMGAPPRILIDAKPHIGTNLLFGLLKNLRTRLTDLGVDVRFQTRTEQLIVSGGHVQGVETAAGGVEGSRVLLAIGHSARDTFAALHAQGVPMQAKPFAVGVRIEHPQVLIDRAQYHVAGLRPVTLPPADYRLTHTTQTQRGVYSFCMCPGGMVVPTATEPGTVAVNGMSTARRSSRFANSGLVVQVGLEDFGSAGPHDPLAGIAFQRGLEQAAFQAGGGGYCAPAMRAPDFLRNKATGILADTHFRPGLTPVDLADVLPRFIVEALREALRRFERQIHGYTTEEANLIAVESRTSSPVRIPRDDNHLSVVGFPELYVAGEGPGYAGGIVSAAVDGLYVAQGILRSLAA